MVSESELVERLREVLRSSDLNTTTTAILRRRLEEDFGVDLSDKKLFIREQVDILLSEVAGKAEQEEEEEAVTKEEEETGTEETGTEAAGGEGSGAEEGEEEEEEGEEEEEEDSGGSRKKRRSDGANSDGKRRGGGFTKLCSLSPTLQEFVGAPELARTEVLLSLPSLRRQHPKRSLKREREMKRSESSGFR
ncbi:hypothetical protein ABZP36_005792 [Zizania latifolia]